MRITENIQLYKDEFIQICKRHHVKSLYVFGSALGEDFDEKSSYIDLSDEDPIERWEKSMSLWDYLESFF